MTNNTIEIEKQIINYLWRENNYWNIALTKLHTRFFSELQVVFDIMQWYYKKYHGLLNSKLLKEQLVKREIPTNTIIKIKTLLMEALDGKIIDEADFTYLCDRLIENYKRNQVFRQAVKIADVQPKTCSDEELDELLTDMKKMLTDVDSSTIEINREGNVNKEAMKRLEQYEHIKEHPEDTHLIKTGFEHIDNAIVGWGYGTSNWVAGRKGDGKSVFLLNIAYYLWNQGKNVLLFSLEIDKDQYLRRWDARCAQVSSRGLKSGELNDTEEQRYREYIRCLTQGKNNAHETVGSFYIVDCPQKVTPSFIEAKTLEIEQKEEVVYDAIIIDYAGIMNPDITYGTLREDLGQISLELKQFARKQNKMVFSAVQMNREGKKRMEDKKVSNTGTEAVADSDSIANHLDNLFAIFSESDDEAVIESLKIRDGGYFKFHIQKRYDCMMMVETADTGWEDI